MNRVMLQDLSRSCRRLNVQHWSGAGKRISVSTLAVCVSLGVIAFGGNSQAQSSNLTNIDCLVEPSLVVELGSAVPGLLADAGYDRSDFVSAGTVMATLESSVEAAVLEIAAAVADAETGLEMRDLSAAYGYRKLSRNKELLASKSISEQNMDQVKTETRMAELQLQQEREARVLALLELKRAQATFNRRKIVSPIAGTVTRRYLNPGEFVDSDPVFQIAQLQPLHVEALLPVSALGDITVGSDVTIKLNVPKFEDEHYSGIVRRIDSVADAASGTYGVRVELENPDLKIPSGVRCQADFSGS